MIQNFKIIGKNVKTQNLANAKIFKPTVERTLGAIQNENQYGNWTNQLREIAFEVDQNCKVTIVYVSLVSFLN